MTYRIEISDAATKDIESFKKSRRFTKSQAAQSNFGRFERTSRNRHWLARAIEIPVIGILVKANQPKRPADLQDLQRNRLRYSGFSQRALLR